MFDTRGMGVSRIVLFQQSFHFLQPLFAFQHPNPLCLGGHPWAVPGFPHVGVPPGRLSWDTTENGTMLREKNNEMM